MIISLYAGDPNEFDIEEPMVEYIIKHIHKYDIDADYYFERNEYTNFLFEIFDDALLDWRVQLDEFSKEELFSCLEEFVDFRNLDRFQYRDIQMDAQSLFTDFLVDDRERCVEIREHFLVHLQDDL